MLYLLNISLQRDLAGRETSAAGNDEKREQKSTSHVLGYVKR
jgi:hypothetical protein